MDANQVHIAAQMSKGYPQMPSDILMMAMLGTFGPLEFTNAPGMRSVSERTEVSLALDLLGQAQGGILVRRNGIWEAMAPSTSGYVLTTHGPDADAAWAPGGSAWEILGRAVFVNQVNIPFMGLLGGYEYHWVLVDITTTGINREVHARVTTDGGASWKTSGYRGMRRWVDDTGAVGSNTFTGHILVCGGIGTGGNQSAAGVLRSCSDFGANNVRKQFNGYNTEFNNAGTFYYGRYAGCWEVTTEPINGVLIFINGSTMSGRINLWRRAIG